MLSKRHVSGQNVNIFVNEVENVVVQIVLLEVTSSENMKIAPYNVFYR